jgi:hypothetical protein
MALCVDVPKTMYENLMKSIGKDLPTQEFALWYTLRIVYVYSMKNYFLIPCQSEALED